MDSLTQTPKFQVIPSDVSYNAETDVIKSKCSNCGGSWEHSGQQQRKVDNYSVDKIDGSYVLLKLDGWFNRFENVCGSCTVKRIQEKDKGVPGSENIHLEGHSYVRNKCICNDDSYRETKRCYNNKCDNTMEYDPGPAKFASCQGVTVTNANGHIFESPHSNKFPVCGSNINSAWLCNECEKRMS